MNQTTIQDQSTLFQAKVTTSTQNRNLSNALSPVDRHRQQPPKDQLAPQQPPPPPVSAAAADPQEGAAVAAAAVAAAATAAAAKSPVPPQPYAFAANESQANAIRRLPREEGRAAGHDGSSPGAPEYRLRAAQLEEVNAENTTADMATDHVARNEKSPPDGARREDTSARDSPASANTGGDEPPKLDAISTDIFPPPAQSPPTSTSTNGVSRTSSQRSPPNPYAIVTLVMINEDYVQAAVVLADSIRRCFAETTAAFAAGGAAFAEKAAPYGGFPPLSRLPDLVVMVDNAVGNAARRSLSKFFDRVVEVTIIEADARQCGKQGGAYNAHLYENWISASFTKFHFLGFDEYKRVMFLDADQLLMGDISHLFRAPSRCDPQQGSNDGQAEQDVRKEMNGSQDIRRSNQPGAREPAAMEVRSYDPSEYDDLRGPGGVECPAAICSAIGADRDGVAKFGRDAETHGRLLSRRCVKHAIDECYGMRGSIMLVEPNKQHLRDIQALLQRQGYYGNRAQGHLGADERLMSERYLDQWHHLHHRYGWISWRPQDKNDVAPTVVHFLTAKPWSWADETWPDFRIWNEAARRLIAAHPSVAPHFRPLQTSVDDDASLGMHALYASVNRTLLSERKKKEEEEYRKLQQRREYRGIITYRQAPVRRSRSHQDLERNWVRADGSRVNLMSGTSLNGRKHVGSFTASMMSVQYGSKPRLTASKSQPGSGSRSRAGAYVPPHLRKKRSNAASADNTPPPEDDDAAAPSKPIDPFPNKPRPRPKQHHSLRSPLNRSPSRSPTSGGGQRSPPVAVSMRVSITSVTTHVRTSPNAAAVRVTKVAAVRGGGGGGNAPSDFHLPPPAVASQRQNGVQHREENGFKVPVVTRHTQAQRAETRPRADAAYANTQASPGRGGQGESGGPQGDGTSEKSSDSTRLNGGNKSSLRFGGGGNSKGSSRFGGSGNSPVRFGGNSNSNSPSRFGGNSRNNSPRLSPQQQPHQSSDGSSRFSGKTPQAKKSLNLKNSQEISTEGAAAHPNSTTPRPSSRDEGTLSAAMAAAKSSQAQAAACP